MIHLAQGECQPDALPEMPLLGALGKKSYFCSVPSPGANLQNKMHFQDIKEKNLSCTGVSKFFWF